MSRYAAALLLAVLLVGCTNDPESVERTTNPEFTVEKLFSHDGCTVYRFFDGRSHYYARCGSNAETMASWPESCGKNCMTTRHENIHTEQP